MTWASDGLKSLFSVPAKVLPVRMIGGIVGKPQPLPVEAAVFIAVVEDSFDPFTHHETVMLVDHGMCFGIELNPAYVDVAVQRWQQFIGQDAVLDGDGRSFDDIKTGHDSA